ncbi:MAG: hypothetical protein J0I54_08175 [Bosea sp.]|uniref:hypothetical protein n=2 Tax=Bosea TaxID=85413 RepID=UPI0009689127|nr:MULTISPECIES: hypothetical protein [unclassified Bosea (in: a-proteobacteria)]MBN9456586.1 hypothetical protein [Bosea sp. (in: a-proteobacteria)]OJV08824.1 MAG: hypothetical protein BGO20_21360 [Bosea sp. 67-29]
MANENGSAEPQRRSSIAPMTAHHLAESVKAGHHGASDAIENQPPAHATMLSQTEQTLIARAREHFTTIRQEAAASLNALQAEVAGRRELFTQQRFEGRVRGVEATMRAALNKHGSELEQRVYDALRAKREYAFFNYENKRRADPKLDKWQFILFFLVVPLVIESLLNGNFFAEASDFGLVGGAATAVIISALNISLGFFMGVGPARYCQHVKSSHLFWALPAYAGMIALIVLFNLAVGHYREMLIANPDARSFQVMPRMLENPFAIYDLKSVALVIIGCIVAFVSATKGYSAFGSYPGHAAAYKRWRQRWGAVEEERRRLDGELLPELEALRTQIDGFREDCRDELGKLQGLKAKAEKTRDIYVSRLGQLRAAKDAAMMQYREANLRVRTDLPPAYFAQALNLAEIDQPGELPEYVAARRQIEDFEQQLGTMPALIEATLKDRLVLLRGIDLAGEVEQVKLRAAQAGREAFERDEAAQKQAAEEFAAMPR